MVRKAIAKHLTVINEKARQEVRTKFAKKSLKPLDIRDKKTRAIRRRMTKKQLEKKTERQWKKLKNFPKRKFALKE